MTIDESLTPASADKTFVAGGRTKTLAEVGRCEMSPEAMIACSLVTAEKSEWPSRDHRRCAFVLTAPIDSVHGCVAVTLSDMPFATG